jgi:hypothetical protein
MNEVKIKDAFAEWIVNAEYRKFIVIYKKYEATIAALGLYVIERVKGLSLFYY